MGNRGRLKPPPESFKVTQPAGVEVLDTLHKNITLAPDFFYILNFFPTLSLSLSFSVSAPSASESNLSGITEWSDASQ
ncbi:hypothetical protein E2C01_034079 [Portunus trituberculatus]|uniref:Uncharacterized protein n=1 Tax=Portunus trituberculatus TaxID=210409 RepID=A0A5B7F5G7_PORTR|nr:hypothetical protein [Portunus trituberculatus]